MGKMHSLSKNYQPTDDTTRRNDWHENYYLQNIKNFVPSDQTLVYEACTKLMNTLKSSLPQDPNDYGLIHGDNR
jgi:Ser/Thr protein kinase RdoA (MazF antagonist)